MKRRLVAIAALVALLFVLDQLFRWLHPEVNLVRASLVGASALAVLRSAARLAPSRIPPLAGAIAIFASAFGSVILIEAGVLVSRSLVSGLVHVAILTLAFATLQPGAGRCVWARRMGIGRISSAPPRDFPQGAFRNVPRRPTSCPSRRLSGL